MTDPAYEPVAALVSQIHSDLIPLALQELFRRQRTRGSFRPADAQSLLERVRRFDTSSQMLCWLHSSASLRQWARLDEAMSDLFSTLIAEEAQSSPAVRQLVIELMANQTPCNVVRLALRGPVHPGT